MRNALDRGRPVRAALLAAIATLAIWAPGSAAEESEESPQLERVKASIEGLGSTSRTADLKRHLEFLGENFQDARPLLEQAIRRGTPRVRALVVKLYGDHGNVEEDLETVTGRLNDHSATVRMAAVASVRRLGKEGAPALLRRIGREPDPGIRKMIIRSLKSWKDPSYIPELARLLADENHAGVRKHLVTALEWLSGERFGDDAEAWLEYSETYALRESEQRILEYSRSLTGGENEASERKKKK